MITYEDFENAYKQFEKEGKPDRLSNYDSIMTLPYLVYGHDDKSDDDYSFRMLMRTRNGNGIVPVTVHVPTSHFANYHFEPKLDTNWFCEGDVLVPCKGALGHVDIAYERTYEIEWHGLGYGDGSCELTGEQLSSRVIEPNERWHECARIDIMDAITRLQSEHSTKNDSKATGKTTSEDTFELD